jgi:hypothetical protein
MSLLLTTEVIGCVSESLSEFLSSSANVQPAALGTALGRAFRGVLAALALTALALELALDGRQQEGCVHGRGPAALADRVDPLHQES